MVALLADVPRITCLTDRPIDATGRGHVEPRPVRHRGRPSSALLRRRRITALCAVVVLVMMVFFGLQAALGRIGGSPLATTGAPGGLRPAASRMWIVRPGDTLWLIAEAVDPGGDVRPLVDQLAAQVGTTALYPGESIAIPTG